MFSYMDTIKHKNSDYVDLYKPIKNLLTDFINKNFLKYNINSIRFIHLIYKKVDTVLNKYKLKLVFKGGNVLRLVNNNIIKYLPNSQKIIKEIFEPFLKKSDNDFTIYIDPNIMNYNEINRKVSYELFEGLNDIRNEILNNKEYYFNIYTLNNNEIKKLIKELIKNLNDMCLNKDLEYLCRLYKTIKINPITDKIFVLKNPENINSDIIIFENKNKKHSMYNSLNSTLNFKDDTGKLISFVLIRMKINFLINNEMNIGGELIDISIPNNTDYEMKHHNTHEKFSNFINENIIKIHNNKMNFDYYIIKLNYIVNDLYRMLFDNVLYPWKDSKYEKRLSRLMYFTFLYEVDKFEININSLELIKQSFKNFYKSLDEKIYDEDNDIELFNMINKRIKEIIININNNNNNNFKEFIKLIKLYTDYIIKIIDKVEYYFKGNKKIGNDIYDLNID